MVKHWKKLPKEVVDIPSLKTFKVRLDRVLSNLFSLKMPLLIAGRLDWMPLKTIQSKSLYASTLSHFISYWKTSF